MPDNIIIRDQVVAALKPLLPSKWRIVPVQRNVDRLSTTVVMLKQQKITKLPAAPLSHRNAEFLLTIAVPRQDAGDAEYEMDDAVVDLLNAIDDVPNLQWEDATKVVVFDQQNPGYDIRLNYPYHKIGA